MDYAAADYEMGQVEEDMYFAGRIMGDTESEDDDDDEHDHLVSSISIHNLAYALNHYRFDIYIYIYSLFCLYEFYFYNLAI